MKNLLLSIVLFLLSQQAIAQNWQANLGLFYATEEAKRGSTTSDVTTTIINAGIGADVSDGFYLGLKYFDVNFDYGSNNSTDVKINALGLSLGYYHSSGFFIVYNHLHEPTREGSYATSSNTSTAAKYSGGDGSIIDLGYLVKSGSYAFGPMFSQAQISYKKVTVGGTETDLTGSWEDSILYPYFVVMMYF